MQKFFNYWLFLIVLIWGVFQTPNFNTTLQQTPISVQSTSINEEDFFNTMFLKSEFFENWSDTNYFINPTLKTSKPLKYSKNWYIDYLKDTYSSGVSYQKPSAKFLDLIKRPKHYLSQIFDWNKFFIARDINWDASESKQYLKNIYEKFLIMIGSGMKLYQSREGETWGKFSWQGWSENDFKAIAQKWDNRLSSFNYFPYHKFNSFDTNNWDYDSLSRSLQENEDFRKTYEQYHRYVNMGGRKPYYEKEVAEFRKKLFNFLNEYSDIVIDELIRVQNGGSCDYDNISDGTERILFSFENVSIKDTLILNTYRMSLTIDNRDHNLIRAGTLSFINKQDKSYQDGHLNFTLDFVLDNGKYSSEIETFSYEKGLKIIYSQLSGFLNLNEFLKQFFSNALIPIFENRSTFIEADYIDNLSYNFVMLNFFGLKKINFVNLLTDKNNQPIIEFNTLIANILTISKDFYKNYIRSLFDTDSNTYVQGYNQEYGLIANNGFKIYPQYFYYDDKYQSLKFDLYSSYNNRFYHTNYGQAFNFDYSVHKGFSTNNEDKYVFNNKKLKKLRQNYPFKYQEIESRSIGYNVFTLTAKKEGRLYRYFDFNFGIYNWQEITKDGLYPANQWWQAKYDSCAWYNISCHIKNGVIWIVNNIPGIKQGNELANGIAYIFKNTYEFFDQIFTVWKFSPALYNTVTNIFLLIIFMKLVRLV